MAYHLLDPYALLGFVGAQVAVTITNSLVLKRLGRFPVSRGRPRVSVLVPVRNEELSIERCLHSLLNQDYPDFEVLVLDDGSTDRTPAVLAHFRDPRLRLITGAPPPDGWPGKHWACQQLAAAATGAVLFFTDADTVHDRATLAATVDALAATGAGFLTGFVRQETRSLGELLAVPFFTWSLFTILPLALARLFPRAGVLAAAVGQFLVFRRETYRDIGGHAAVRTSAVDDLALGRLVRAAGVPWAFVDASRFVSCRMYRSLGEAVTGFTKNYFALFDYRLIVALFVWAWLGVVTWVPLIGLVQALGRQSVLAAGLPSLLAVLGCVLLWALTALRFEFPMGVVLVYPLVVAVSVFIGVRSIVLTLARRTTWKGRRLASRIRLP